MAKRHSVEVPNARGRVEVVEPGAFAAMRVELDGQPIPKKSMFSRIYPIPTNDGGTFELDVMPDVFRGGFVVKGPGLDTRLGEPIPLWLGILAFLPFGLTGVGGLLGGIFGGLGWVLNQQIVRQSFPAPVRAVLMLAVTGAAVVTWMMLGLALQLALGR